MDFTYNTIKALAAQTGRKVTDLIALAAQNDPFYTGTPNDIALGEWFAAFYHSHYSPGTRVHVRRCHYAIVSLNMTLPSGKPYENTMECWETLLMATKAARYLGLVPVESFEDKKHAQPIDYTQAAYGDPEISVYGSLYSSDLGLSDFPGLPDYSINAYESTQPYHLEMWCEKTTMNDILLPLCERYNMVLQTGAGELSITATKSLAQRIATSGKPARIFYISDYDPAGQSMPVAVSRKLEFFVRSEDLGADVRLFPVVLTSEQVARYNLPRTPIKESERRKESFEARHGLGATELDALQALRPGELNRILKGYIEAYYDTSLAARTYRARRELEANLAQVREQILAKYQEDINELRAQLEEVRAAIEPSMSVYRARMQALWEAMTDDMQENALELKALPEPRIAKEIGSGLYNSERDYLDQIDAYKAFQGK